jgi:hypothetical protein
MATNVIAKAIIDNPIFEEIFTDALRIVASGIQTTQTINTSDEDIEPEF